MREFTAKTTDHQDALVLGPGRKVQIGAKELEAALGSASGLTTLQLGSKQYNVYIHKVHDLHYEIWIKHYVIPVTLETPLSVLLTKFGASSSKDRSEHTVKAPMPGLIKEIHVAPGAAVQPGTPLIVLEAMKMENELRSSVEGVVKNIVVKKQEAVEKNQLLIELAPPANVQ